MKEFEADYTVIACRDGFRLETKEWVLTKKVLTLED